VEKFQRSYQLIVENSDHTFQVIELPFTMDFTVNRSAFGMGNDATITILNLSKETRTKLRLDWVNCNSLRKVVLLIGYGSKLSTVFDGNLTLASSVRDGSTWKTTLQCTEGQYLYVNGKAGFQFPQGVTRKQVLETIIADMSNYGVKKGVVGDYPGELARGNTYSGNHVEIMQELTGGGFSVQSGRAYCIGDTEFIQGSVQKITPESGLLNTPTRETTIISVEMILEPDIIMYQGITLESISGDNVDGFYKVISISHSGTISEVTCGNAVTRLKLSPNPLYKRT